MIATAEVAEDGGLSLVITLNLEAAVAGIGAGHKNTSESPTATRYDRMRSLKPAALRATFDRFAPDFLDRITLNSDIGPVSLKIVSVNIPEVGDTSLARISEVGLSGSLPARAINVRWRLDPMLGNSVIRLRDRPSGKIIGAEYVLAGKASGPLSVAGLQRRSWISVFANFLEVGFTHIVPKGLDHVLFVVGLFLLSIRISALLWQVTAFTVAHTVTLGLGMAGIVQLSPSIVEPLIAASIVYVAVENVLTDRLHRWRPVVVFGFGLLHGLGFASVLREIGSAPGQFLVSLVGFNLGVELGQLAVITVCFLAVGWTMNRAWRRRIIVIPGSLAIGLTASFWFLQRTGFV